MIAAGVDTDSGYSSRPSTSLSVMSPRPIETSPHSYLYSDPDNRSIAEVNHLNSHQQKDSVSPDPIITEETQSQDNTGINTGIILTALTQGHPRKTIGILIK